MNRAIKKISYCENLHASDDHFRCHKIPNRFEIRQYRTKIIYLDDVIWFQPKKTNSKSVGSFNRIYAYTYVCIIIIDDYLLHFKFSLRQQNNISEYDIWRLWQTSVVSVGKVIAQTEIEIFLRKKKINCDYIFCSRQFLDWTFGAWMRVYPLYQSLDEQEIIDPEQKNPWIPFCFLTINNEDLLEPRYEMFAHDGRIDYAMCNNSTMCSIFISIVTFHLILLWWFNQFYSLSLIFLSFFVSRVLFSGLAFINGNVTAV